MSEDTPNCDWVWVFAGERAVHPAGVFRSRESAELWILANRLSGLLTAYPLDTSVYDWSVKCGYFTPKKAYQKEPEFMARFSSAYSEHYHYENGSLIGTPESDEGNNEPC